MSRVDDRRRDAALLLGLFCLFASPILAQQRTTPGKVELTGIAGYQFGGGVGTAVGDLRLDDAINYGGSLGFRIRPDALVTLIYNYQSTSVLLNDRPGAVDTTLGDVAAHQIQIGSEVEKHGGKVIPFGMGHVGITIYDPKVNLYNSETQFSMGFGGGVKVPTSSGKVGLRLQGRLWITWFGSGGGFWCSSGGACAISGTGTAILQGEFSGGVYLAF